MRVVIGNVRLLHRKREIFKKSEMIIQGHFGGSNP